MQAFDAELSRRLDNIRQQGLFRELRRIDTPQSHRIEVAGRSLLNFSSNDYLGLANAPELKEAAITALRRFGSGSGASRLICGSLAIHHELEEALADFKQLPAALTFSSGYAAAVGTICALMGKDDIIIIDRLVHACVIDAARLCGAKLRVYAHNDLESLKSALKSTTARLNSNPKRQVLIVTESVFSMDGDIAPLKDIVELKNRYGAWLMVDEAHATGLYGPNRRGLAELSGTADQIEIQMGTLGKALGAAGGYVCGSRKLIDYLVNRARSFIFSTAPVPAAAAAANAALQVVRSSDGERRCHLLWERVGDLRSRIGFPSIGTASAIVPCLIGNEAVAVNASSLLREQGLFVPAIRYPTVPRGKARLRLTLTAEHTAAEVVELCSALAQLPVAGSKTLSSPTPA